MSKLGTISSLAISAVFIAAGCGESDGGGAAGQGASLADGTVDINTKVACPDTIPDFTLGLEAEGDSEVFKIHIVSALPSPPEKFENDWVVEVTDMDGEPVTAAELTEVEPFMPVHGHDGTYAPDILEGDGDGQFAVERINMWMGGPWEVRFWVREGADGPEDYVVFDICIED